MTSKREQINGLIREVHDKRMVKIVDEYVKSKNQGTYIDSSAGERKKLRRVLIAVRDYFEEEPKCQ